MMPLPQTGSSIGERLFRDGFKGGFSQVVRASNFECLGAEFLNHLFFSCSFAAVTTWFGSNPNFVCSAFNGAEAPKVFMPITRPELPTYRSHPRIEPCSTATRAFTFGGRTLSR